MIFDIRITWLLSAIFFFFWNISYSFINKRLQAKVLTNKAKKLWKQIIAEAKITDVNIKPINHNQKHPLTHDYTSSLISDLYQIDTIKCIGSAYSSVLGAKFSYRNSSSSIQKPENRSHPQPKVWIKAEPGISNREDKALLQAETGMKTYREMKGKNGKKKRRSNKEKTEIQESKPII